MWDRVVNFIYSTIRGWSNLTFIIVAASLVTLGFLFIGNFLKANKKESPKFSKPSQLLWSIVMLITFVVIVTIRT